MNLINFFSTSIDYMYLVKIYKGINFILKKTVSKLFKKNILLCLKDIYFTHLKIKEDNSYQLNSL